MPKIDRLYRTPQEWESSNPILGAGQTGKERFSNKVKVGDGKTPWNSLSYLVHATDISTLRSDVVDSINTEIADRVASISAEAIARASAVATETAVRAAADVTETALRASADATETALRISTDATETALRAAADATEVALRSYSVAHSAKEDLIPVGVSGAGVYCLTANTTSGTGRMPWVLTRYTSDLAPEWVNEFVTSGQTDTNGATDLVIAAGVLIGAQIYQFTFGGRVQATISPGGRVVADPLPVDLPAGTVVQILTFVVSGTWYTRTSAQAAGSGGWTVTSDLTTPGSAAVPDSTSFAAIPGPVTLRGRSGSTDRRSLLQVGDSIAFGQGDGITGSSSYNTASPKLGRGGWLGRAAATIGIGVVNIGTPTDRAMYFITALNRRIRMAIARGCTTAVVGYGRNDVTNGQTLAQIQASLLTIAGVITGRGINCLMATITPVTTSTDGWRTIGNQTVTANDAVRLTVNAWLRAGAPVTIASSVVTPAVSGAPGAVYAAVYGPDGTLVTPATSSTSGHPIAGVVDPAATVEDGSSRWLAASNTRTVADGVTTAAASAFTSATIAWTTADIGRQVTIAGAGTAGALYVGIVKSISGSSAGITPATPTAVSGATVWVGDNVVYDGTHPGPDGHDKMSSSLSSLAVA